MITPSNIRVKSIQLKVSLIQNLKLNYIPRPLYQYLDPPFYQAKCSRKEDGYCSLLLNNQTCTHSILYLNLF